MLYSFYVGSTMFHTAHAHIHDAWLRTYLKPTALSYPSLVFGVWEGETEATAIYTAELDSDATAQRIAYAMAMLTANDVVMVTRDTTDRDTYQSLNSTVRYRATRRTTREGNRTILRPGLGGLADPGYRYESDPLGAEVVFLVGLDATVSAL